MSEIQVQYCPSGGLLASLQSDDSSQPVVIVGAGIFGSVMAERLASVLGRRVVVLDRRDHIGGNSAGAIDPATGIEIHRFGSHIFHTKIERVWRYITQFTEFNGYRHRVLTTRQDRVFTMPISLMTVNSFFGLNLKPSEVAGFIQSRASEAVSGEPSNLEEKAISLIGEDLYYAFIEGYTAKQWGRSPRLLPPEIITRLPVRDNYNVDYFDDRYQGIPAQGYQRMFENLLAHPLIRVFLNVDFFDIRASIPEGTTIIYTGMIDRFFDNCFGPLEWRGLRFESETLSLRDAQGISVMNYADASIPYTRIHEYKHYHPEWTDVFQSGQTIVCREYPSAWKPGDEAYYPINDAANRTLYEKYAQKAREVKNLIIGGRLGAYRYWDMDKAIDNALETFEKNFASQEK